MLLHECLSQIPEVIGIKDGYKHRIIIDLFNFVSLDLVKGVRPRILKQGKPRIVDILNIAGGILVCDLADNFKQFTLKLS